MNPLLRRSLGCPRRAAFSRPRSRLLSLRAVEKGRAWARRAQQTPDSPENACASYCRSPSPPDHHPRIVARAQTPDGDTVFAQHCAICHEHPTPENKAPPRDVLATLGPDAIFASLTEGNMRIQGQALTPAERQTVAERVAGRPLTAATAGTASAPTGLCTGGPLDLRNATSVWNGWGPDVRNARFQANAAGITAANVANLKLKWAFGVPNATQSRSQPAVVGGRLFMASQSGMVYALDPAKGCTYWSFKAQAGVRTAISVGTLGPNGNAGGGAPAVFFSDAQARAYAVDFRTGQQLWVTKIDDHPAARATGSPTYYDGRLYVVLSGVSEESSAAMPDYECCKFRGSLTALDAKTGTVVWKTYTVGEPKPRGKSTTGKQLWGPAGAPIWSAPTIDAKRGLIYAATGNAYADPAPKTSDAIVAFDLKTGKIRWVNQIMPDTWILGCSPPPAGAPPAAAGAKFGENPNCPKDVGPDFDFSASPMLVTKADGKEVLVATQKSGVGYSLDPDKRGKILWQYRWGKGSPVGGVWGAASDGERATSPSRISSLPRPAACTPWLSRPASASGTRRRSRPSAARDPAAARRSPPRSRRYRASCSRARPTARCARTRATRARSCGPTTRTATSRR